MIDRLDNWIFKTYKVSASELGVYRIIYGLYIITIVGFTNYSASFRDYPRSSFDPPPGVAYLFSEIPPLLFFQMAEWVIFLSTICILLGFLTRFSSIAFTVTIVMLDSIYFGSGKIDHSFVVWLVPFMMSFSNWGARFSLDEFFLNKGKGQVQSWPITYMSLFVGFGFFTAGIIKLAGGWLSFSQSMVQGYVIRNAQLYDRAAWLCEPALAIKNVFFWETLDWMTIGFEISFLFVAFSPIFFRLYTLHAVFFHVGILLLMKITFSNYIILYLLFWLPMFNFQKFNNQIFKKKVIIFLLIISLVAILFRWTIGYNGLMAWAYVNIFKESIAINQLLILGVGILASFLLIRKLKFVFSRSYQAYRSKNVGVISFDGYCNLCNRTLLWIIKNDKDARFKFRTLSDNEVGTNEAAIEYFDNETGICYRQSRAFLEICRNLDGWLPLLYNCVLIPWFARDAVYNFVARNRYKWFGKKDQCLVPSQDIMGRFIDSKK